MKFESQFGICDLCFGYENVLLLDCACGKSICYRCAEKQLSHSVVPFVVYEDLRIRCSYCFFFDYTTCWYCGRDKVRLRACKCSIVFHEHCAYKFSLTRCPLHYCWKCQKQFAEYRYCCYICLHTFHKSCLEQAILLDRDEPMFSACLCADCCRKHRLSNYHGRASLAAEVRRVTGRNGISLSNANLFFYKDVLIDCLDSFFLRMKTPIYKSVSEASQQQRKYLLPVLYAFMSRNFTTELQFVLFRMLSAIPSERLHFSHNAGLFGGLVCIIDLFLSLVDRKEFLELAIFARDVLFGQRIDSIRFQIHGPTDRTFFDTYQLQRAANTLKSINIFSGATSELYNLSFRRLAKLAGECQAFPFRAQGAALKIAGQDTVMLRWLEKCSTAMPVGAPILFTLESFAQIIFAKRTALFTGREMEQMFGKTMCSVVNTFAPTSAAHLLEKAAQQSIGQQQSAAILYLPRVSVPQGALSSTVLPMPKLTSTQQRAFGLYVAKPVIMSTGAIGTEPPNKPTGYALPQRAILDRADKVQAPSQKMQAPDYKVSVNYGILQPNAASIPQIADSRWLWQSSDKESQRMMRHIYIATAGYIYNFTGSSTISTKYVWSMICLIRQEMQQSLKVDPSQEQVHAFVQRMTNDRNFVFLREAQQRLKERNVWVGVNPINIPLAPHFFFAAISKAAIQNDFSARFYALMRELLRDYIKVLPPHLWSVEHLIHTLRKELLTRRLDWHTAHVMFYFSPNQPPVVCRTKYSDFEQSSEAYAVSIPQLNTAWSSQSSQALYYKPVASVPQVSSSAISSKASSPIVSTDLLASQKQPFSAGTPSGQSEVAKMQISQADSALQQLRSLASSTGGLSTETQLRISVIAQLRKEQADRLAKHRGMRALNAFCFEMPDYLHASLSELQAFLAELRQRGMGLAAEQTIEFAEDQGQQYSAYVHSSEY